jgi:hypothetical protein
MLKSKPRLKGIYDLLFILWFNSCAFTQHSMLPCNWGLGEFAKKKKVKNAKTRCIIKSEFQVISNKF